MANYHEVLQKFNNKGWNLYARERNGRKLEVEKMLAAKELKENIKYLIWPKGFAFGDQDSLQPIVEKHGQFDCSIEVPKKISGSVTYRFDGGRDVYPDSLSAYQGQRIDFIGLTLRGEDVQLFRSPETHINLDDFIEALESLQDLTKLITYLQT